MWLLCFSFDASFEALPFLQCRKFDIPAVKSCTISFYKFFQPSLIHQTFPLLFYTYRFFPFISFKLIHLLSFIFSVYNSETFSIFFVKSNSSSEKILISYEKTGKGTISLIHLQDLHHL